MEKNKDKKAVKVGTHIDAAHVQVYKRAKQLDKLIEEEKDWCVQSIVLGIKENVDELIKLDIEPTSDGGINVCASLLVQKQ